MSLQLPWRCDASKNAVAAFCSRELKHCPELPHSRTLSTFWRQCCLAPVFMDFWGRSWQQHIRKLAMPIKIGS